jgi:hypothetical protein
MGLWLNALVALSVLGMPLLAKDSARDAVSCTLTANMDCNGNDLFKQAGVEDAAACCDLCQGGLLRYRLRETMYVVKHVAITFPWVLCV